jgi:hypothetical protein
VLIVIGKYCHRGGQNRPKTQTVLMGFFVLITSLIFGGAGQGNKID